MKKILCILAALTLALLLPLGALAENATITVWHNQNGPVGEVFKALLEEFIQANPEYTYEVEDVTAGNDSMATRISTALAADDLPDIFWYWGGFTIEQMARADKLMDVQEYFDASEKIKADQYSEAALSYMTIDGILRGIPRQGFYCSWMCNKEIFEALNLEYPETMQDVIDIAAVLNENGYIPLAMGSSGGNPAHYFMSDLFHQLEGGTAQVDSFGTTYQYSSDVALKVAQQILDLRAAKVFPEDTIANGDWTPSFELYNSGRAAMVYSNHNTLAGLSEEMFAKSVIIDIPTMEGAVVDPSTYVQSSANNGTLVSSKGWNDPAKREGIIKFMDWWNSDEVQQALANVGSLTTRITGITYPEGTILNVMETFYEGRPRVKSLYNATSLSDAWNVHQASCDELFAGHLTAEEFVEKIQEAYDEAAEEAE